jgi:hypothetical protein
MVRIISVDRPNRKMQGMLKDNTAVPIAVLEVPDFFVWPQVGENWMVESKANTWYLQGRIDSPIEDHSVEQIPLGDGRLNAINVRLRDGDYVVDSKVELPLVITGSRSGGEALLSLLTQLADAGIIEDNTTS